MKRGRCISILMLAVVMAVIFSGQSIAGEKATKDECIEKTKAAVKMAEAKGLAEALNVVQDKNGPFVWKDTYVFCIDMDRQCNIAHPIKPTLVGKNLMAIKDAGGKLFFAEFINVAREKGQGWVSYMWPKVGEKKSSPKVAYVHRVPGTSAVMIAGIYE